jgi:hypothetical protein
MKLIDRIPKETEFPASRSFLTSGKDEATAMTKSQGLQVDMEGNSAEYLTSVLSLAGRLPPFDHAEYNGY